MQSASYTHPPQSIARCGFLLFPPPIVLTNLHHTKDEGIAVLASNTHCDLDDEKVVHDHPCICLSTGVASLFALLMQDHVSAQFVSRSPARPLMNTALIQTPSVTLPNRWTSERPYPWYYESSNGVTPSL